MVQPLNPLTNCPVDFTRATSWSFPSFLYNCTGTSCPKKWSFPALENPGGRGAGAPNAFRFEIVIESLKALAIKLEIVLGPAPAPATAAATEEAI
jgi:hypothetical protein